VEKIKIALAADHGGFRLKESVKKFLKEMVIPFEDFGTYHEGSCDWVDFGRKALEEIVKGRFNRGILFCGTGIGMSVLANKFPGIRAALCYGLYAARQSREHMNSNVLVLAGRMTGEDLAKEIVRVWLESEFKREERYLRRLGKLKKIEEENFKLAG